MVEVRYRSKGVIHSLSKKPPGTHIQPRAAMDIEGNVQVFPESVAGLKDLDGFSHVMLLYHFHLVKGFELKVKPLMNEEPNGVLDTRTG